MNHIKPLSPSTNISALTRRHLVLTGAAMAGAATVGFPPAFALQNGNYGQDVPDLNAFAENQLRAEKVPGLSAAVFNDKGILWSRGYGLSDIENNIPMQPNRHQILGSITKTVTTTAVLKLVEKGALDLDADISDYLPFIVRHPKYPEAIITLRQLITHTSSLLDGPNPGPYNTSYRTGEPPKDYVHFAQQFYGVGEQRYEEDSGFFADWEPGEKYKYANVTWALVAKAIETASGQPFTDYTTKEIFTPLGMANTAWTPTDLDESSQSRTYINFVDGAPASKAWSTLLFDVDPKERLKGLPDGPYPFVKQYAFPSFADGGLWTTSHDIAKYGSAYLRAYHGRQADFLKKSTVRQALSKQLSDRQYTEYRGIKAIGFTWRNYHAPAIGNKAVWGHTGGELGSRTVIKIIPQLKLGVVSLANINEYREEAFADVALQYFAKQL
ncbi:MAG: serine hydrolase domain-containing protein [Pseudomonadota bacterium]